MYKMGDIQEKYKPARQLAPVVYNCEIYGKPKANYNHVRCSKIKQQRFLNENAQMR
jgi:hypothetical protein